MKCCKNETSKNLSHHDVGAAATIVPFCTITLHPVFCSMTPSPDNSKMALVQQLARPLLNFIVEAVPVIVSTCQRVYRVYSQLPMEYVQLIVGAVMCFFGGFYPTVFAALQVSLLSCRRSVYTCPYFV